MPSKKQKIRIETIDFFLNYSIKKISSLTYKASVLHKIPIEIYLDL